MKFGGLGSDWHLAHGHRKWKVQLLAESKLVMKWLNKNVLSCFLIVLIERFRFMTGKAFHRREILLKYEYPEVLLAPKKCCNLCALANRDEPM